MGSLAIRGALGLVVVLVELLCSVPVTIVDFSLFCCGILERESNPCGTVVSV